MNLETMNIVFVAFVFIYYVGYIYDRYGVLKSISHSFDRLKESGHERLFGAFCIGLAIPMFGLMLVHDSALFMMAGGGFFLTGITGEFKAKKSPTRTAHFVGSGGAIIALYAFLWSQYGNWYLSAAMGAVTIVVLFTRNRIWWWEIAAGILAITGLIIK